MQIKQGISTPAPFSATQQRTFKPVAISVRTKSKAKIVEVAEEKQVENNTINNKPVQSKTADTKSDNEIKTATDFKQPVPTPLLPVLVTKHEQEEAKKPEYFEPLGDRLTSDKLDVHSEEDVVSERAYTDDDFLDMEDDVEDNITAADSKKSTNQSSSSFYLSQLSPKSVDSNNDTAMHANSGSPSGKLLACLYIIIPAFNFALM